MNFLRSDSVIWRPRGLLTADIAHVISICQMAEFVLPFRPGTDYPERIKQFRARRGLTQQALADRLGVSFATVNRWENGQTKPSQLSWNRLRQLEKIGRASCRE